MAAGRADGQAVTATATQRVRDDVLAQLRMRQPQVFLLSASRANLHYEVRYVSDAVHPLGDVLAWLQAVCRRRRARAPGGRRGAVAGIIYCLKVRAPARSPGGADGRSGKRARTSRRSCARTGSARGKSRAPPPPPR